MDKYGVVGNPIQHSLSPQIHTLFAKQTQQALVYEKYLIEISEFETAIRDFQEKGFKGLNVTAPFKERAFAICDELSERAKLAGAVNTLIFKDNHKIAGDNTDGMGLIRDITIKHNFKLKDKSVLLVGAGGAARSVLKAIRDEEPKSIIITNRTALKAKQLAEEFSTTLNFPITWQTFESLAQPFDCVINATAMGLDDAEFPLSGNIINSNSCCYEMVYNKQTRFLTWAQQNHASLILDGFGMLVEQAAEAFFIWRGVRPNTKGIKLNELL